MFSKKSDKPGKFLATSRQHVKIKMAEKSEVDEPTIATDLVVTKYKMAAEMVNGVYLKDLL